MREPTIDEKLRIIRPLLGHRRNELLRQKYYLEDDPCKRKIVELKFDTLISRLAKRSIDSEIFLPPPKRKV
mgnify:CR=1 FL=1